MINTLDKLRHYIRTMLGEPTIRVEVSDQAIDMVISDTITRFTDYSWEGELVKALILNISGKGSYTFNDDVREVLKCVKFSGFGSLTSFTNQFGQDLVPNAWINATSGLQNILTMTVEQSNLRAISEKYFGAELNYSFSAGKNMITIFENYTGPLIIEYVATYTPSSVDMIYNHPWVKEYALNKTKFLWGTITGKYSQSLVGGATINYADMKQEADTAIQNLDEILLTRYTDSAPIDIG